MANNVDPDQNAPIGVVCSGSMFFALILNSSVMLCKYLQQTTSADSIFRCIFFLGTLRVKERIWHFGHSEYNWIDRSFLPDLATLVTPWSHVGPTSSLVIVLVSLCHNNRN